MTLLELKDKKANLLAENDRIFEKAEGEKRDMSADESASVTVNLGKIAELELRISSEEKKVIIPSEEGKQVKREKPVRFSLIKAINERLENKPASEATSSIRDIAAAQFRAAGVGAKGDILIPAGLDSEKRTEILAGTATHGAEVVATDIMPILPPLVDELVFTKAGATYLNNLVGNVQIPSYAGTTADWGTEVAAITDSSGVFADITLTPKRLCAVIDISKLFLIQDSAGAEALLYSNIQNAVARKLESTILGKTTKTTSAPGGMSFAITTGVPVAVATPTRSTVVGQETAIGTANVQAKNLAYITNSTGRGILKNIVEGPSGVGKFMLEDNQMNGYPVYVTNACPTDCGAGSSGSLLVFGNWADLCIGQWGGYDITVDPYTVAHKGEVRLVINAYFDAKGLRGSAASGSGYDDYITSFSAKAIKA
jgi:HK97 family phage major capsid protein